jgi:hypothetical protein
VYIYIYCSNVIVFLKLKMREELQYLITEKRGGGGMGEEEEET